MHDVTGLRLVPLDTNILYTIALLTKPWGNIRPVASRCVTLNVLTVRR